jgi:hypothetical protein
MVMKKRIALISVGTLTTKKQEGTHIPLYVAATPDKKYRKNPYTYLNSRMWEDEELPNNSISTTRQVLINGRSVWVTILSVEQSKTTLLSNTRFDNYEKAFHIASADSGKIYRICFDDLPSGFEKGTVDQLAGYGKVVGEI